MPLQIALVSLDVRAPRLGSGGGRAVLANGVGQRVKPAAKQDGALELRAYGKGAYSANRLNSSRACGLSERPEVGDVVALDPSPLGVGVIAKGASAPAPPGGEDAGASAWDGCGSDLSSGVGTNPAPTVDRMLSACDAEIGNAATIMAAAESRGRRPSATDSTMP